MLRVGVQGAAHHALDDQRPQALAAQVFQQQAQLAGPFSLAKDLVAHAFCVGLRQSVGQSVRYQGEDVVLERGLEQLPPFGLVQRLPPAHGRAIDRTAQRIEYSLVCLSDHWHLTLFSG